MFETTIPTIQEATVQPSKVIILPKDHAGHWLVTGDVDGDGEIELVSARNEHQAITAACACKLDGSVLWTWGEKGRGSRTLFHDLPLQVHDIDENGKMDVFLSTRDGIIILDGENGKEVVKHPLPPGLKVSDCITFTNMSSKDGKPSDMIIKSRYDKIWVFTSDWEELWSWPPGQQRLNGMLKTCHHPEPFDLDHDGRDEILGGNIMLDHDGSELWMIDSHEMRSRGHLDALRLVHLDVDPERTRLAASYCGADCFALLDGTGRVIWQKTGEHYESIDVGQMDRDGREEVVFFVDCDHLPRGKSKAYLFSEKGDPLGLVNLYYGRQHRMVDWTGDGASDIVLGNSRTILDSKGNIIAILGMGEKEREIIARQMAGNQEPYVSIVDVNGNDAGDVILHTLDQAIIHENPNPVKITTGTKGKPFRDEKNFTFY